MRDWSEIAEDAVAHLTAGPERDRSGARTPASPADGPDGPTGPLPPRESGYAAVTQASAPPARRGDVDVVPGVRVERDRSGTPAVPASDLRVERDLRVEHDGRAEPGTLVEPPAADGPRRHGATPLGGPAALQQELPGSPLPTAPPAAPTAPAAAPTARSAAATAHAAAPTVPPTAPAAAPTVAPTGPGADPADPDAGPAAPAAPLPDHTVPIGTTGVAAATGADDATAPTARATGRARHGGRARRAEGRPGRDLVAAVGGGALAVGGVALGLAALLLLNGEDPQSGDRDASVAASPDGAADAGATGTDATTGTDGTTGTDATDGTAGTTGTGTTTGTTTAPGAAPGGTAGGAATGAPGPAAAGATPSGTAGTPAAGTGATEGAGTGAAPPPARTSAPAAAAPARAPLTVLNNSRITGLAERSARRFRAAGWPIADVGNFTGRIRATTVYYEPGQLDVARALARRFPGIERVLPRPDNIPGRGLTVVLTRDFA